MKQVILRLLHHWLVPTPSVAEFPGRTDIGCTPLAGTPVQRLALHDHVVHGARGLFDGRVRIGSVAIDQIDVVQAEALEAAIDGLHQVLAVEGVLAVDGIAFTVKPPEELRADDVVQARPLELAQGLAHHLFTLACSVDLGIVEEVDPRVVGRSHHLDSRLHIDLVVVRNPGPKRQGTDAKATSAQVTVEHGDPYCAGSRSCQRMRSMPSSTSGCSCTDQACTHCCNCSSVRTPMMVEATRQLR